MTARWRISGGTDGADYKITCVADDDTGNTFEVEGVLQVRDL